MDTSTQVITIDKQYVQLPAWYGDLRVFIQNRRAPKQRENIKELLKLSGCDTITGFLDISHALSLIDTFWVKSTDSALCWDDLSLYTHPFNEVIAKTAFEGGLHGRQLSTTSPEYGTDGSFAKCWIRENGIIKMLKRGSSGAFNAGLEPYSEYYAGQIIERFTDDFVRYDLRTHGGRVCSVCDIFTSEDYGFVPYAAVDSGNSTVEVVLEKMADFGLEEEVRTMFVVDALILNEDRHKNNFGFLVDNKTLEIQKMAPLFDHNVSLLTYAVEKDNDFNYDGDYFREKGPRIGNEWILDAVICMTSKLRRTVIDMTDFQFERHPKHNLPESRLKSLEKIIQRQAAEILKACK
ncbi:MAG: HipA protein [Ruminococcus flavefaciens]|nr:HipA protein [Ruminococcus flavefaciens]